MTPDPIIGGRGQRGFTLIEALIAVVILIFGVAAVANLMIVAGSSNTVANHTTASALAATQQMELLKSVPFVQVAPLVGGSIDTDVGITATCGVDPVTRPGVYNCTTDTTGSGPFGVDFKGVGAIHVRWQISPPVGGPVLTDATPAMFIQVAAESAAPAVGRRSRVVLTTYRTLNP